MIWTSATEFLAMGGYGLYVWGSFVVCAAALALEHVVLRRRTAAVLRTLRRRARAQWLEGQHHEGSPRPH